MSDLQSSIHELVPSHAPHMSDEVTSWLGRLVLLYGIPFHYLVPEEAMLPAESIRFFYLDPIWIQNLLQGACSIGDYVDRFIDEAMNALLHPKPADSAAPSISGMAAAGVRDQLRMRHEGIPLPDDQQKKLDWPLTGFLLRSAVVKGWRGLEFEARKGDTRLKPLRIEQLSPDIMLGIFQGDLDRVIVRQPPESLHFGLTLENGSYTKSLRTFGYKDPKLPAGSILNDKVRLSQKNLMRQNAKHPGVVKIAALAKAMKCTLESLNELKEAKFTSAEFAVQMLEAAGEFTILRSPDALRCPGAGD